METRWDGWPLVTLTTAGESPDEARAAVVAMLHTALDRGEEFAALLDLRAIDTVQPGARPTLAAEHARAVKQMRPALADWCLGLAFVMAAPAHRASPRRGPGERFWGCEVTTACRRATALAWVERRLATGVAVRGWPARPSSSH